MSTKIKFNFIFIDPILLAIAALAYYYYLFFPLDYTQTLRLKSSDLLLRISNRLSVIPQNSSEFTVIAINESCLAELNKGYPIKKDFMAEIVNKISKCNPRLIFLNVLLPANTDDDLKSNESLINAFKNAGNVVLPAYYDITGKRIGPAKEFNESARKSGFINKIKDDDLSIRRCVLFHISDENKIDEYALETQIVSVISGASEENIVFKQPPGKMSANYTDLYRQKLYSAPIQPDGSLIINYQITPKDFNNILISDFLGNKIDPSLLKDKVVVVTDISEIEGTAYNTPIGIMPGVYICLNEILMLLSNNYIYPAGKSISFLIALIFAVISAFLPFINKHGKSILFLSVGILSVFLASVVLIKTGVLIDYFSVIVTMIISYVSSSFLKYILALQEKIEELKAANLEIKRAQEELIRKEQLSTIGNMTAKILHEIKGPLFNIKSCLKTIRNSLDNKKTAEELSSLASDEMDRVLNLSQQLRETYTPHISDLKPMDINLVIQEVFNISKGNLESKKIRAELLLGSNLPPVNISTNKIKQVFTNLLNNAADAMKEGGTITVATQYIISLGGGRNVVIAFKDTGHGIPKDVVPELFKAFFTTKQEKQGSGLGLFICKEIIKAHKGDITVASELNKGTTFKITLPCG